MKRLRLVNSEENALVDDDNFEALSKFDWFLQPNGAIARCLSVMGRSTTIYMHREILKPQGLYIVDHRDRNKLNNQKSNLRLATKSQNAQNSVKQSRRCSSKFKGVYWQKNARKWRSYIQFAGNRYHLGFFKSQRIAALAYDAAATILFGDFARLNIR